MEKKYVDEIQLANLQEQINELKNTIATVNNCYPVGSIYISVNSANPKNILGIGTWTQIENRFLLAAGSAYVGGTTGGSATVALSNAQVPAVNGTISMHSQGVATNIHDVTGCFSSGLTNENSYRAGGSQTSGAPSIGRINFSNGGTGAAHNNMPPYLVVYIWKRTA